MSNISVPGSDTSVPGVTGGAGYHAGLLTTSGAPVTWYIPSLVGRDAAEVAAGMGFSFDRVVIDVWVSAGIGQAYTWNTAALTAAGATVGVGAGAPSLAPGDDGIYRTNRTWLSAGGTDYLAPPPGDVALFLPNFEAGAGVRAVQAVLQSFLDGTYPAVRIPEGVTLKQGPPAIRFTDDVLSSLLLGWMTSFPAGFDVSDVTAHLGLILADRQIGVYRDGANVGGHNAEGGIRDAMLDALEAAVLVVTTNFANPVDGEALRSRVEALRLGNTSGVVTPDGSTLRRREPPPQWRKAFAQIFSSSLTVFSSALG